MCFKLQLFNQFWRVIDVVIGIDLNAGTTCNVCVSHLALIESGLKYFASWEWHNFLSWCFWMTVEKTDFIILEFNYSRNAKSFLRLNQPSMWSLIQNFLCVLAVIIHRRERKFWFYLKTDARFRCCSTHVLNLTNELSMAKEQRLNQFGVVVLVRCGKSVKLLSNLT